MAKLLLLINRNMTPTGCGCSCFQSHWASEVDELLIDLLIIVIMLRDVFAREMTLSVGRLLHGVNACEDLHAVA